MRTPALALALALALLPIPAAAQGLFEAAMAGNDDEEEQGQESTQEDSSGEAADESASGAGLSGSLGGLGFELNGRLRAVLYMGKVADQSAGEVKAGYGEAALLLRARKGSWGDAFGEIRLRGGLIDGEVTVEPDLREGYVNLFLGPLDLRVGHQVIIWGRADGVNPTNNLTPRDMRVRSPYEDDARLANLALRAHLNLDALHLRWEVVWVPLFRATRLPSFDLSRAASLAGLPSGVTIGLGTADYPDADITNGTVATRVHLLLSAVEASVSYLIGTSVMPGLTMKELSLASLAATMAFTSYRHQVIGADFSTALLGFGVRGEFAYRVPLGFDTYEYAPRPELSYVLGLDREFFGELNIILQYSGKAVLRWDDTPGPDDTGSDPMKKLVREQVVARNQMIAGQLEQVQHGATFRVAWNTVHETLHLELMGNYNFSTEELMLRPKITYDIADALSIMVGGEVYLGPDESLFGMIEQTMSAGYVEVRASF